MPSQTTGFPTTYTISILSTKYLQLLFPFVTLHLNHCYHFLLQQFLHTSFVCITVSCCLFYWYVNTSLAFTSSSTMLCFLSTPTIIRCSTFFATTPFVKKLYGTLHLFHYFWCFPVYGIATFLRNCPATVSGSGSEEYMSH